MRWGFLFEEELKGMFMELFGCLDGLFYWLLFLEKKWKWVFVECEDKVEKDCVEFEMVVGSNFGERKYDYIDICRMFGVFGDNLYLKE